MFEDYFKNNHPLVVFVLGTLFIIIVFTGFKTINTLLFETHNGGVRYKSCLEEDYDEQGSYCVNYEYVYTTFEKRINSHFEDSLFWSIILGFSMAIKSYAVRKQKIAIG